MFDVLIAGGDVYKASGRQNWHLMDGGAVALYDRLGDPEIRATFSDPHQLSAGVSEVLVNGKVTISGGAFTGELAGHALAGPGARR